MQIPVHIHPTMKERMGYICLFKSNMICYTPLCFGAYINSNVRRLMTLGIARRLTQTGRRQRQAFLVLPFVCLLVVFIARPG